VVPVRRPAISKPTLGQTTIAHGSPLAQGLIGAWTINDGAGTVITDATNTYGNGSIINGGTWEVGTQGLDVKVAAASSQYIQIPHNAAHPLTNGFNGPGQFSHFILVWLNSNRNYNGLFTKTQPASNVAAPWDVYVDASGTLNYWIGNGGSTGETISYAGIAVGQWIQVLITGDTTISPNGVTKLYYNGALVGTGVIGNISDQGGSIRLGNRNDNATVMDGKIGAAYLWNRVVTGPEAQMLAVADFSGKRS
jgi:hypothetical protein